MHGQLKEKKCEKGGQHVMVMDLRRRYLYAWMPRHKFFQREPPFTQEGPAEVSHQRMSVTSVGKFLMNRSILQWTITSVVVMLNNSLGRWGGLQPA